ncbi:MAG: hypothetical protein PHR26_02160 [Candidatus ainarchaeum sp.]|nr:hypothetical protein [Candidatus ainarchaeum sp.]MDD3975823.1 hypothetical protein [Candidatus ainarchaeum sp.]
MKLEEIKPYQKKISFLAKVISKTPERKVVSRLDDVEHKVCEVLLGDDTGIVYLTLWDDSINLLEIGKVYSFKNLYSSEFKKSLRLNLGRFGEFDIFNEDVVVDLDKKLSSDIVID